MEPHQRFRKSSKSRKSRPPVQPPNVVVQQLNSEDDNSGDLLIVDDISNIRTAIGKVSSSPATSSNTSMTNANSHKRRKRRDSASSDEERWLTAIESGKLEDVDDELRKIKPKDPSLMTARQRAMYDRGVDGNASVTTSTLMSLPTGYKEKIMTAEAIQKAALKSQKRKQMADEKREKDKKKTMERLLKKQESKAAKAAKIKIARANVPMVTYRQNSSITTITFPPGIDYPITGQKKEHNSLVNKDKFCCMGCGNLKKYSCSQTHVPLCSLQCYKKNIASRIL